MSTKEAITRLDQMQGQVIHGKRIFGDIADVLRLQQQRAEAWRDYAAHQECCSDCSHDISNCPVGSKLSQAAGEIEAMVCNEA